MPFFRTRLAILDDAGGARPRGEVGEVAKRGLLNGPVYLGDGRRTEEALRDGWFRTGDLGYVDEDGYLFIVTVPAGEAAALKAVTTTAYDSQGFTGITVDGKTWELRRTLGPQADGQFAIQIPDKNTADQLLSILVPSA